jgi:DNA-directed RNA polymerase specialized sigma24 family protein
MTAPGSAEADGSAAAFLRSLVDLERALEANEERARIMRGRILHLREALGAGKPLTAVVNAEDPPLLVEMLTQSGETLHRYGSAVRRSEARALYAEGLTMEEIAHLFGVSRQRVSMLLRDPSA